LSEGVQNILARYSSNPEDNKVGKAAFSALAKLSNMDPSEAVFEAGEEFQFPDLDTLQECTIIRKFNGREIAAFAIDTNNGSKLLYVSSLRKAVPEYEQTPEGIQIVRNGSSAVVHSSGTKLRDDIMKCGTIAQVAKLLAGQKIKVTKISDPITTARFERRVDASTGNATNVIVGLRQTTIPYFDYAE
jgi:hypothetical protein